MGLPAFNLSVEFVQETCISCGCPFGIPAGLHRELNNNHKLFYCPSGHGQLYPGESDVEKAKRLLLEEQARHQRTLTRENAERAAREIAEAELKRHQKRAKNGVCPCCKRTFKQLATHMKTKHPDYGA